MVSKTKKTPKFSLKDQLFNPEKVQGLSKEIAAVYPDFSSTNFEKDVTAKFPDLELKERVYWMTECLTVHLPDDYIESLDIIRKALPEPCDPSLSDDDFGDFIYLPYGYFITKHGLTDLHLQRSLSAIEELTTRFSCEDVIRPFMESYPNETLAKLTEWSQHPHYHVRRLVSEGTRPLLPWASKIQYRPEYLKLLDALAGDSTRYVTRSVANHLNDVSKSDPDAVVGILKRWEASKIQPEKEWQFMRRHALRTLIKKGHVPTLEYLGYPQDFNADIQLLLEKDTVKIGEALKFKIKVEATAEENILLDYVMDFQGKGDRRGEKVFKLKTLALKAGESVEIEKKYTFTKGMSTRSFYPGPHSICLQVNGRRLAVHKFVLDE